MLAAIGAFVVGGLGLAIFTEHARAAGVLALPYPGAILNGEPVSGDVTLAIEEVDLVFLAGAVVADDLDAADADTTNETIGRVNDDEAAGSPFVDVAGKDLDAGGTVRIDGVPLVDPAANDGVQALVLGTGLTPTVALRPPYCVP